MQNVPNLCLSLVGGWGIVSNRFGDTLCNMSLPCLRATSQRHTPQLRLPQTRPTRDTWNHVRCESHGLLAAQPQPPSPGASYLVCNHRTTAAQSGTVAASGVSSVRFHRKLGHPTCSRRSKRFSVSAQQLIVAFTSVYGASFISDGVTVRTRRWRKSC